jgi:hypothetical protein
MITGVQAISNGERNRMLLAILQGQFGRTAVQVTQLREIVHIHFRDKVSEEEMRTVREICRYRFGIEPLDVMLSGPFV